MEGKASGSDLTNEKLFVKFQNYIDASTCSSKENKILVILDNHKSHILLDIIDKTK